MSELHFSVSGSGKTVVFLHGFLESSTMWEYLDFTDAGLHCIFVDIPGHGQSQVIETSEISIEFIAALIIEKLLAQGINSFDIIGHSMGGYIALAIAQQVSFKPKVILLNSNFWDDSIEKKNNRNRVISIISSNKDLFIHEAIPGLFVRPNNNTKAIEKLITEAKNISIEGITYACIAMRDRPDLSDFAESIAHELVCIQGEKDSIVTESDMKLKCGTKIPFITIPNAGHMSHIESSHIVQKTITDLLFERL
jgi:pimeloyl-ACP methyl ester carboxylesterase